MDIDCYFDPSDFYDERCVVEDCCIVIERNEKLVYLSGGRYFPEGWYPSDQVYVGDKVPRSPRHRVEVPEWLINSKKKSGAKCRGFTTED